MKKLFIIANWKSNKLQADALNWLKKAQESRLSFPDEKIVIVCPAHTLLTSVSVYISENGLPFKVGAQDVSPFGQGAYTGAVSADQVKEYAAYSIIGHSERRRFFGENEEMLFKKTQKAIEYSLTPVYCVQGKDDSIPAGVKIVAYEPVNAIGTGNPDTPENADEVADSIKKKNPQVEFVLYGGSVIPENVSFFTQQPNINGVLVGGASLPPKTFFQLAKNA